MPNGRPRIVAGVLPLPRPLIDTVAPPGTDRTSNRPRVATGSATGAAAAAVAAAGVGVARVGLRRLTVTEIDNSIRDLLQDDSRPAARFLPEEILPPFDND